MVPMIRRQFLGGVLLGGPLCAGGLLAACGQPEPTPGSVGGAGGAVAPTALLVPTPRPGTPGTPGDLPTPTAMPTALGTVVLPTAPTEPYPRSGIRTPETILTPLPYSTPRPEDPLRLVVAPARVANPSQATARSAVIIIGTVVEIRQARWSTPDGRRPPNPRDPQSPSIFTPVFLQVAQVLKGVNVPPLLAIAIPEGSVGDDSVRYSDGIYSFQIGQQVALFLTPRQNMPQQIDTQPAWSIVERYTVTAEQQATNSYQTLPLPQLLSIISSVVNSQPTPSAVPQSSPVATPQRP